MTILSLDDTDLSSIEGGFYEIQNKTCLITTKCYANDGKENESSVET